MKFVQAALVVSLAAASIAATTPLDTAAKYSYTVPFNTNAVTGLVMGDTNPAYGTMRLEDILFLDEAYQERTWYAQTNQPLHRRTSARMFYHDSARDGFTHPYSSFVAPGNPLITSPHLISPSAISYRTVRSSVNGPVTNDYTTTEADWCLATTNRIKWETRFRFADSWSLVFQRALITNEYAIVRAMRRTVPVSCTTTEIRTTGENAEVIRVDPSGDHYMPYIHDTVWEYKAERYRLNGTNTWYAQRTAPSVVYYRAPLPLSSGSHTFGGSPGRFAKVNGFCVVRLERYDIGPVYNRYQSAKVMLPVNVYAVDMVNCTADIAISLASRVHNCASAAGIQFADLVTLPDREESEITCRADVTGIYVIFDLKPNSILTHWSEYND